MRSEDVGLLKSMCDGNDIRYPRMITMGDLIDGQRILLIKRLILYFSALIL